MNVPAFTRDAMLVKVIRPALIALALDGPQSEELLLGVAAQESGFRNIQQVGGPALGLFQMEPRTHDDLWKTYLNRRGAMALRLKSLLPVGTQPSAQLLLAYPAYAAGMTRAFFERIPAPLPPAGDLEAQAAYYKKFYNTAGGAATQEEYMANYKRLAVPPTITA